MMRNVVILILVAGFLGGCTKFSCGQFPQSGCQPVSHVYDRTNEGFYDYRSTLNKKEEKSRNKGHRDHYFDDRIEVGDAHKAINHANPGDPILTKPVVMRVLFAPWEDNQKDLNIGGYVYLKIRDAEWVLSERGGV